MSDDVKCECGCERSRHIEANGLPCRGCDDCYEFRPAEEAKPCAHDWQPDPHGGGRFCPLCQAKSAMPTISLPIRYDLSPERDAAGEAREIAGFYAEFPRGEMKPKPEPATESVFEAGRKRLDAGVNLNELPEFVDTLMGLGEAAEKRAEAAERELEAWRNREAACCPEDVGFPEHIEALTKRAETAEKREQEWIAAGLEGIRLFVPRFQPIDPLHPSSPLAVMRGNLEGFADRDRRIEAAEAKVRELEEENKRLAHGVDHFRRLVELAGRDTEDALALLKPVRPEDGLLPAIRDVLQQLVNEREGGEDARKECGRLEKQIAIMVEMWPTKEPIETCPIGLCKHCHAPLYTKEGFCGVCGK
jgi:hypothetical protein